MIKYQKYGNTMKGSLLRTEKKMKQKQEKKLELQKERENSSGHRNTHRNTEKKNVVHNPASLINAQDFKITDALYSDKKKDLL